MVNWINPSYSKSPLMPFSLLWHCLGCRTAGGYCMKLLRLLFLVMMMLRAIWQVIIRTWILADYGVFSPIIAGGFMWATPINVNGTCMCKSSLHQWENWPLKQNTCLLDLLIQKHPGTAGACDVLLEFSGGIFRIFTFSLSFIFSTDWILSEFPQWFSLCCWEMQFPNPYWAACTAPWLGSQFILVFVLQQRELQQLNFKNNLLVMYWLMTSQKY